MVLIGELVSIFLEFIRKIYEVTLEFINQMWNIINFIIDKFPFDDSKKTFMLAILWFIFTFGMIYIFTVDYLETSGNAEFQIYDYEGTGYKSISKGTINETGIGDQPPISGIDYSCESDNDCFSEGLNYLCCTPNDFNGRSCQGICLSDPDYTRDYCNSPNACDWSRATGGTNFVEFVKNQELLCINKVNPQIYCSQNGYGYCNGEKYSVCYGYCMLEGKTVSIQNTPNDCINEDNVETILNEYQDGQML